MAQTVILNMIPKGIPDVVYVSQYDAGRELIFKLYEGVSVYTIPANVSVIIGGKKEDNHTFAYTATIAQDRHSVSVETTEQMTACAGENLCQLRILKSGLDIATVNFRMIVQERPDASGDPSETDIPALVELAQQQVYDAEAWAKGTKNGIDVIPSDPQYNDHAKYWAEVAEQWAEQFINGVVYKGSVLFANIPTTGMLNGWMYNITDAFTTDNRFKEGSGIYCEAGTNIIWNDAESLWDLAGGFGGVQSFNGRHGNILPQANDYDATQIKYGTNSNVNAELNNKTNLSVIAEEFDSTSSYAVGNYVMYNGVLYKCTTAHTGTWADADFTETKVSDEFGGGSETAEYRYNIVTKSTSGTNATVTVNKYVDNSLESSTDYKYNAVTTPANIDGRFTLGYSNSTHKFTMTLVVNSTTHAGGYEKSWPFSESVDFSEIFIDSANDITYIAPAFSSSTAYNVGDLVTYEGRFYKCTTSHSAGAWDINHFTGTDVDEEFLRANGVATSAAKVAHKLKLGSVTNIDFDGSVAGGVDMWSLVCPLTASGWSALADADGFYTQDIYPTYNGNTAYFDMDKPVIITIASAPNNQRPTSAEQAAYNMIDPTWYYPDSGTRYFRFYTKTKPTTDFYVRVMGFSVYNTI